MVLVAEEQLPPWWGKCCQTTRRTDYSKIKRSRIFDGSQRTKAASQRFGRTLAGMGSNILLWIFIFNDKAKDYKILRYWVQVETNVCGSNCWGEKILKFSCHKKLNLKSTLEVGA